MLQLYPGNLSAMQPSHYGAFKDLRKEINHLDSAMFSSFVCFGIVFLIFVLIIFINISCPYRSEIRFLHGGQDSPFSFPRRSFNRLEQSLLEEESWFQSGFQPCMSVTETAKEKFRSLSTPRQRAGVMESWLDDNKKGGGDKVSLWSSFVSEASKMSSSKKSSLATTQHCC